jgi:Protein kinase domain
MTDELIGSTLGQYSIKSLLGKGGMAKVYVAYQSSMNRDVAIKVMNIELSSNTQFVSRFKLEASVIAQLEHPHILPVIDFGEEDNLLYIVMRLVKGDSLDQRLREGPIAPPIAIEMLRQIGSALGFAHQHDVIHRDLKPSNVLLDDHDNTYLADFGIAKLMTSQDQLTDTHSVLGTPHYMAPEQWRGEGIDGRTDIYSLGVMAYQMLTGKLPFLADTPFHIMHHHVNTPPPPLPTAMLTAIPDGLTEVIHKALAKDSADRYQTAQEMVIALTNIGYSTASSQRAEMETAAASAAYKVDDLVTMTGNVSDEAATLQQPLTPLPAMPTLIDDAAEHLTLLDKTTAPRSKFLGIAAFLALVLIAIIAGIVLSGALSSSDEVPDEEENVALMTEPVLEDFDENTLLWDRIEANRYIDAGKYHTLVLPGEGGSGLALAQAMPRVADVRIEVEVENLSEVASQIIYALLWRLQDDTNYYRFTVTNDGQAGIIKRVADEDVVLSMTSLPNWDMAQKQHVLAVEMVGGEMILYVDNQVVLREYDASLSEAGGVGLVAFREGAHVAWDNLHITPIDQLSDPASLVYEPYTDDFADNSCGWAEQSSADATMAAYLADGQYHLQVPEGQVALQTRCANLGLFADMRLQVHVENQSPSGNPSVYGIVFRQSADGASYYVMAVNDRGQINFQKYLADNPDCQPCTIGNVEAIPGYLFDEPHVVGVDVVGDTLRGYVDGELVIESRDADISGAGIVRLGAYFPNTHIVFDDLSIQPYTELPAYIREAQSIPTAPFVMLASDVSVSLPVDAGTAITLGELPLSVPLQNMVIQADLRFEAQANDQCGFAIRTAGLNQERFVWLNLSPAGVLAFGNEQAMPNAPLVLESISAEPMPMIFDLTIVARDDSLTVYVDGELLRPSIPLSDPDPIEGGLFAWLVLSGNHPAACNFNTVRVWSLD